MVDSIFHIKLCSACGISNLDGDPCMGIPFANVALRRKKNGDEMLCDDCERMSDLDRVKKMLTKDES